MFLNNSEVQSSINGLHSLKIHYSEPQYHFESTHSPANCCLNSPDPAVAAYHKTDASHSNLKWSNLACEYEKALFQHDTDRQQQCLNLFKQPWVPSILGYERVTLIADRFNIAFLKERVAVQSLIRRVIKDEQKGFTTCQYGSKNRFKFVAYLDKKPPATPTLITSIQRQFANNFSPQPMLSKRDSVLLRIMKWAHANNELATLGLIEQFLLSDVNEKYFGRYMQLHLANRFNFPSLRMKCLSSLRTIDSIDEFQSSRDYYHHLSSIDRELIETRAKLFRDFRNADQKIPDEVYHFDLHSGSYFTESIEARYNPALYSESDDTSEDTGFGGGEITVCSFEY